MRWRGLAASCCPAVADRSVSAGPAGRAPRAASRDCSRHALVERVARCGLPVPIARVQLLRGAGAPPVRRSRSLGSSSYADPLLAVRQSRLLGSGSYGERLPRRPGPDRSGPASAGLPRLALPRLLRTARRAARSDVRPGDCSPVHTSELITLSGTRCEPRSPAARRAPGVSPGPVPVPGDKEISSGRHPAPQGLSGSIFHEFRRPQDSPQAVTVVPRKPGVVHRVIHRYIHSHPPDRPPSGHHPVHVAQSPAPLVLHTPSGPAPAPPRTHRGAGRRPQAVSVVDVGAVAAAAVAAGAAVGQEAGGQHEQSGGRVEVAGLARARAPRRARPARRRGRVRPAAAGTGAAR